MDFLAIFTKPQIPFIVAFGTNKKDYHLQIQDFSSNASMCVGTVEIRRTFVFSWSTFLGFVLTHEFPELAVKHCGTNRMRIWFKFCCECIRRCPTFSSPVNHTHGLFHPTILARAPFQPLVPVYGFCLVYFSCLCVRKCRWDACGFVCSQSQQSINDEFASLGWYFSNIAPRSTCHLLEVL